MFVGYADLCLAGRGTESSRLVRQGIESPCRAAEGGTSSSASSWTGEESGKKLRWNELGIAKECGIVAKVSSIGEIQKLDITRFERDIQVGRTRLAWGGDLVFFPPK